MDYKTKKIEELYQLFLSSTGVTTDSRLASEGKLFFALKGENFDGNEYAEKAISQGAIAAVVEVSARAVERLDGEQYFKVEDTLQTLQELANYHRRKLNIPVVALTGTNGKTTTKELIRAVLSKKYNVSATVGNLNNHIGVPLTILGIDQNTEIAVVEMGASGPCEIKLLTSIAEPSCGLITNVGKAHLQGFGSFEGVVKAKGELYDYLSAASRTAFVNSDNDILVEMINQRKELKPIYYGPTRQGAELLEVSAENPFMSFYLPGAEDGIVLVTNLVGAYNLDNALAAIAVGIHFGVSLEDATLALSEYLPTNNRSELRKTARNLLIVDAYNANPTSMAAALDNFEKSNFENKMVILGDMRELGSDSSEEHLRILKTVQNMSLTKIILVGEEFSSFSSEFSDFLEIEFYLDVKSLINHLLSSPIEGFSILIKGSNGVKLQTLLDIL